MLLQMALSVSCPSPYSFLNTSILATPHLILKFYFPFYLSIILYCISPSVRDPLLPFPLGPSWVSNVCVSLVCSIHTKCLKVDICM